MSNDEILFVGGNDHERDLMIEHFARAAAISGEDAIRHFNNLITDADIGLLKKRERESFEIIRPEFPPLVECELYTNLTHKKPKKGKNQRQKRKFNRQNPHSKKYRK